MSIHDVEIYQDGAMWRNSPCSLAYLYAKQLDGGNNEPIVVSVGTGVESNQRAESTVEHRRKTKIGFLFRVVNGFRQLLDGARQAIEFSNYVAPEVFWRFDVDFPRGLASLDNTEAIPEVAHLAELQFSASEDIQKLARRCLASFFHFELNDIPLKTKGRYLVQGQVLCVLENPFSATKSLLKRIRSLSTTIRVNGKHTVIDFNDTLDDKKETFRQQVSFYSDTTKLSLEAIFFGSESHHISGSPFEIEDRVRAQGLDAYFGESLHRKRLRYGDDQLPCLKRSQKKRLRFLRGKT